MTARARRPAAKSAAAISRMRRPLFWKNAIVPATERDPLSRSGRRTDASAAGRPGASHEAGSVAPPELAWVAWLANIIRAYSTRPADIMQKLNYRKYL